ncbi:MAG: class I SAM-dependent methyltransferase, partial [Candidatus Micrarchaeia archaeon]
MRGVGVFKKIILFFYRIYATFGSLYLLPLLKMESKLSGRGSQNERPVEYSFAFRCISKIYPKTLLDVGSGESSFPDLVNHCGIKVVAADKISGYWKSGFFNRHYYLVNDDIAHSKIKERFDVVTCISVLEHIHDSASAVKGMFDLLKPGGYLVMTFPYNEKKYVGNAYRLPNASYGRDFPFICQIFSRKEIDSWLKQNKAKIVAQEYYDVFTGEF